jgi:hypothetical protein
MPGVELRAWTERRNDRGVITRLEIRCDRGIRSSDLRAIRLNAVEAMVNMPERRPVGADKPLGWGAWRKELKLKMPKTTKYPDSFYVHVAELYGRLTAGGWYPARVLHDANPDIPITTIHRWIAEARRRGFLPPGKRGAAG